MALDYHYFNLHKKVWSVQNRGKVIAHVTERLIKDPEFVVRPAGQRKVREQGRKNVHAFVKGEASRWMRRGNLIGGWVEVSYNPYRQTEAPTAPFYEKKTGRAVFHARWAHLTPDRKLFVRYH